MLFSRLQVGEFRKKSHVGWDVFAAVALKLMLLLALYLLFFGPAHQPSSDAVQTGNAIVGAKPARDVP